VSLEAITNDRFGLKFKEKIINPDFINFCFIHNCPAFGFHKVNRKLTIGFVRCESCDNPIKSYRLDIDSVFGKLVLIV
jgi:hypothetical protein